MDKKLLKETVEKENVILFFYADWCGGCKVASPMVQQIATKLNLRLIRINENEELEEEYEVDYYPHLILANKGKLRHYPGATMIKSLYESIT
jgi:thiol-disulfide isomerase/thioredoxin